MEIEVRKLNGRKEMLAHIDLLRELYPTLEESDYSRQLDEMLPHNYFQVGAFDGDRCMGISGVWIGNKLWCGKYLEIDHIVIRYEARSEGIGKTLVDFLKKLAEEQKIDIKFFNIIYEAIDYVQKSLSGLLEPDIKETILGSAEIQKIFKVSGAGKIAGSKVINGEIKKVFTARKNHSAYFIDQTNIKNLEQ